MNTYCILAHNTSILVNPGDVINGSERDLTVIGSTGNSTGKHVHFGALKSNVVPNCRDFDYVTSKTIDPESVIRSYGEVTPNDITLGYKAMSSPYSVYNPHAGIDFSGVCDKAYERPNTHGLTNGKIQIKSVGYDKYFGNYVIFQVLGKKEIKKETEMIATGVDRIDSYLTSDNVNVTFGNNTIKIIGNIYENGKEMYKIPSFDFLLGGKAENNYTSAHYDYVSKKLRDDGKFEVIINTSRLPHGNYVVVGGVKRASDNKWYHCNLHLNMNIHGGTNNNLQIRIN